MLLFTVFENQKEDKHMRKREIEFNLAQVTLFPSVFTFVLRPFTKSKSISIAFISQKDNTRG